MNYEEEAAFARSAGMLAGLLSRGFLRPGAALAEEVRSGAFARAVGEVVAWEEPAIAGALEGIERCGADLRELEPDGARLALEVDYNRLFVGPGSLLAPPYESYYASARAGGGAGRLRTDDERAVVRAYRAQGFCMPDAFVDLPDHVAVELDFLAQLARREAICWDIGNAASAEALQQAQEAFRREHLGAWVGDFAVLVAAGARTPFYPALTVLAQTLFG